MKKVLTKRGASSGARITAMTRGPKGRAWVAVPGRLLCLDPGSGELIEPGSSKAAAGKGRPRQ